MPGDLNEHISQNADGLKLKGVHVGFGSGTRNMEGYCVVMQLMTGNT